MLHEVIDAALAAGNMPLEAGAHHTPAEPRSVGHRDIRVRDAEHSPLNQIEHLLVQRSLHAVGRVARQGLSESHRFFPVDA
jgi:hypothetical protein